MNEFEEFKNEMKRHNLNKEIVIFVLNTYVNARNYVRCLENFKDKIGRRDEYEGVIYSAGYEENDEEYFGAEKILFYVNDGDKDYDEIINYTEFYHYLSAACEFYIKRKPEKREEVESLLEQIKESHNLI